MNPKLTSVVIGLVLLTGGPIWAQTLDVPIMMPPDDGQAAVCASSLVAGLDPNGDGFLAVRTGPGTQYRKIDQLYNGDVVATCDGSGRWVGVLYRARGSGTGPANRRGWVHGNWLRDLAG